MIATPNRDQIKYTSATVQDERIFKKLKLFFELRRDDESPFSAEEIVNAYGICKNGKSFASRPGDVIFLLSANPVGKKAAAMLRVRKAVGLYGLVSLVPGMILTVEPMINAGKRDIFVDAANEWTVYTHDRSLSAQWEHTILITENGPEILTY